MSHAGNERTDVLPFVPRDAKTFLDIGCSDGKFAELLAGTFGTVQVDGIEPDQEVGQRGASHFRQLSFGFFPDVVPDGIYDCITFLDCLEHMVEPWSALKAARNYLAPGGSVVASIPNARHIRVLQTLVVQKDWLWEDQNVFDRTHLRWFTQRSIGRMFRECGFEVQRLEPINVWKNPKTRIASVFLGRDIAATQFVVVARAAAS
jgi:2-polyprenyl-3-methyl-5-hydroxy-6-metoxy-1,4-benzoquinol methylase